MAQNIIIRLPDEVEDDRELARELATEAVSIGFDFAAMFPDREAGAPVAAGESEVEALVLALEVTP